MASSGWLNARFGQGRAAHQASVQIDDRGVTYHRPDGRDESVPWHELRAVEIVTTNAGPWSEDVFWVLHGKGTGGVIPQGAEGHAALLDRLQQLPGFDNHAVIQAMGTTDDDRFLCWQTTEE